MPEELWTEVCNNVQEVVIKTIPKKKKCKKAKWLSEEDLQIAEKRRDKKKKERQRMKRKDKTHLMEEFQRIARRDKKAFLSEQCKEIEENNRMGKTRDLNKKIRDRLNKVWSSLEDDCYRKNRVGEIWYIGGIGAGYSVAEWSEVALWQR